MIPKVSVIIPTYNRAHIVGNAIQSVLNQSFNDYEVIVVDDGSTDNTKEIVEKFGEKVIYVYQENKERSAARNNGIKEAKGKYIAFLDSDDLFLPEKLQIQVDLMDKNPDCGMSYSHSIWFDNSGKYLHTWRGGVEGWIYPNMMLVKNTKLTTPSIMIRKSVIEKVGYFNEQMNTCEDYEFWCRIAKDYRVLLIRKSLVIINTDINRSKDIFYNYFNSRLQYYQTVFNLDPNLDVSKKKEIFLDLFKKYYLNSSNEGEKEYVLKTAKKISQSFPVELRFLRFLHNTKNKLKKINVFNTIIKFIKNYILISVPKTIFSEDMEYNISKNIIDKNNLNLIRKYYMLDEASNVYRLKESLDGKTRKHLRNIFLNIKFLSSNRIATILKLS